RRIWPSSSVTSKWPPFARDLTRWPATWLVLSRPLRGAKGQKFRRTPVRVSRVVGGLGGDGPRYRSGRPELSCSPGGRAVATPASKARREPEQAGHEGPARRRGHRHDGERRRRLPDEEADGDGFGILEGEDGHGQEDEGAGEEDELHRLRPKEVVGARRPALD